MQIVFNKIPRLALVFYAVGFLVLTISLILFFYFPEFILPIRLQQSFIGGAILVAVGSVINTLYQFRRHNPNKKE